MNTNPIGKPPPRSRRKVIIAGLLAIVLIGSVLAYLHSREPVYQGKPLSYWLKQLDDGNYKAGLTTAGWRANYTPRQTEAIDAIREMGTNSFPFLLQALEHEDSALKLKFNLWLNKQSLLKMRMPLAAEKSRPAALALVALGPAARPLTPALEQILNRKWFYGRSQDAANILGAIGPEGWDVLAQSISNKNGWVSACATWGLASHHATVTPATMEALMAMVGTNNVTVNSPMAIWALRMLAEESEHAIPALVAGLNSPDAATRAASATGLGGFGTNAASALPARLQELESSIRGVESLSTRSFMRVEPKVNRK